MSRLYDKAGEERWQNTVQIVEHGWTATPDFVAIAEDRAWRLTAELPSEITMLFDEKVRQAVSGSFSPEQPLVLSSCIYLEAHLTPPPRTRRTRIR